MVVRALPVPSIVMVRVRALVTGVHVHPPAVVVEEDGMIDEREEEDGKSVE